MTSIAQLTPPSASMLRAELFDIVKRDLLGPAGGEDEEIHERTVRDRYCVGMLAPKFRASDTDDTEDLFDELAEAVPSIPEEGPIEISSVQSSSMQPSAFGMTFCVRGDVNRVVATVRWGKYDRVRSQISINKNTGEPALVWRRHQVEEKILLKLEKGRLSSWAPREDQHAVVVRGVARKRTNDSDWSVSLFLINGQQEPKQGKDSAWLFQPQLIVEGRDHDPIFTRRGGRRKQGSIDPEVFAEIKTLEMAYRRRVEFAVGHGVSVHVDKSLVQPTNAMRICTEVVPTAEVARSTPPTAADIPALGELILDMRILSETGDSDFSKVLSPLTSAYDDWIEAQKSRAEGLRDGLGDYVESALNTLEQCAQAKQRINAGIELLSSDPDAATAFRFLNNAMWQQRIHSIMAERVRQGVATTLEEVDVPKNRTWYPFQLAFILLNLPSLTQLDHPERSEKQSAIADLLWFATGGGKSEAYLGLTAYTLAIRRLQGDIEGRSGEYGVAVLMRYTLRLLTLQQFQRAAALICACEKIRRDAVVSGDIRFGATPFRVGLWVGNKATPKTTLQSEEAVLLRHDQNSRSSTGDPNQLTNCPWCGKPIDPGKNVKVDKARGRTIIYCSDTLGRCIYSEAKSPGEGLPVLVVDEEIYRQLPSLVIATVDKFAQMPWNGVTQMLFGRVNGLCSRHGFRSPDLEDTDTHIAVGTLPSARTSPHGPLRPPDLIIQDELHLISGPLGTLVGLYETAVDYLCTWTVGGKAVRPKVIASTATIRNASLQVVQIFARKVSVFPPQGLDIEDNFFSVQRTPDDEVPGRLYIGICAPGKRLKSVLLRVYLAYLAAGQVLLDKYGQRADPWMTLVGYFNSMRELGGMRRLVDDQVRSGLRQVDRRGLSVRKIGETEELTSRRNSADIPDILNKLERTFNSDPRAKRPIDVLLATNMLSVGVDVRRLGLMIVANQPKTTSEYIQATSRVGRNFPGMVCTVLNWARPRDLSHYEQFEHYHDTFYQYVESLSVTPFSERAIDRGLAALLVSSVRLQSDELNSNNKAAVLDPTSPVVRGAVAYIARRAENVGPVDAHGRVAERLDALIDSWRSRAQNMSGGAKLGYQAKRDGVTQGLLQPAGLGPWQKFTCLNSLRDVEPMVNLILDNHGLDDSELTLAYPAVQGPEYPDDDDAETPQ